MVHEKKTCEPSNPTPLIKLLPKVAEELLSKPEFSLAIEERGEAGQNLITAFGASMPSVEKARSDSSIPKPARSQ